MEGVATEGEDIQCWQLTPLCWSSAVVGSPDGGFAALCDEVLGI